MAVIALTDQGEVEAEAVDMRLLRASERQPPARRMGGVVDVEWLAAAVARGHALDLEGEDARTCGYAPNWCIR
jgi:hypothetical protein